MLKFKNFFWSEMRLRINFSNENSDLTELPCHYNQIIQGFIYRHLDNWIGERLHNQGMIDPETERRFKMFTFSRLIPDGKFTIKEGKIRIYGSINLTVASPLSEFIESFAMNMICTQGFTLAGQRFILNSIFVEGSPEYRERVLVKTLSPITVYSTLISMDNKKKTYYYSPFEEDFERLVIENLSKKLRALTGEEIKEGSVKPVRVTSKNQRIVLYKGTVIKGWDGIYELRLPKPLFDLAFDTGLGSKNSQGFGCVEIY